MTNLSFRFSDFIEKQNFQFDNKGQPLYSPTGSYEDPTRICVNTNFNIFWVDYHANSVVVDQRKYRYTKSLGLAQSIGMETDSYGRILTSDLFDKAVLIFNLNGQFLCFLHYF